MPKGDGPGYAMGNDGNSNSKGASENQLSLELNNRPKLDSGWSYPAQFKALKACGAAEDLTFQEGSVKDVTDRGRTRAAARLQATLEEILRNAPQTPRIKNSQSPATADEFGALFLPLRDVDDISEHELRQEVRILCKKLQRLREGRETHGDAMGILVQLERLPVTVRCLKATKVAAELNHAGWRGHDVSIEVRQQAAALVKRWRTMYRAEEGTTETAASLERRCKILSMDLESAVYAHKQRVADYLDIVQRICALLLNEPDLALNLSQGQAVKDLVSRVARKRKIGAGSSSASTR